MATWDDLRRIALALPEVAEEGSEHPSWRVKSKSFVWDRPPRRTDLHHLDAADPTLLDELVVEAWLARAPTRLASFYLASRST